VAVACLMWVMISGPRYLLSSTAYYGVQWVEWWVHCGYERGSGLPGWPRGVGSILLVALLVWACVSPCKFWRHVLMTAVRSAGYHTAAKKCA
jgi:hypothetical protein